MSMAQAVMDWEALQTLIGGIHEWCAAQCPCTCDGCDKLRAAIKLCARQSRNARKEASAKSRADFEACVTRNYGETHAQPWPLLERSKSNLDGYLDGQVQQQWLGWKAARQ